MNTPLIIAAACVLCSLFIFLGSLLLWCCLRVGQQSDRCVPRDEEQS